MTHVLHNNKGLHQSHQYTVCLTSKNILVQSMSLIIGNYAVTSVLLLKGDESTSCSFLQERKKDTEYPLSTVHTKPSTGHDARLHKVGACTTERSKDTVKQMQAITTS